MGLHVDILLLVSVTRLREQCSKMVLVEELEDEDDFVAPLSSETAKKQAAAAEPEKKSSTMQKGFFDKAKDKPLYGPEGSSNGYVSPDTHKAHQEHNLNEDMRKGMNRGAEENNGYERPAWYTKDWPKDCQYNSPGCALNEFETSKHASDLHKKVVVDNDRWQQALTPGSKVVRCAFMQMTDEDLAELVDFMKGNEALEELDLSHNNIKDKGVQDLVAALATGKAAPNLKELRIYKNSFTDLGKTMLMQGLKVFRKKLDIRVEEPNWAKLAEPTRKPEPAMEEPVVTATECDALD